MCSLLSVCRIAVVRLLCAIIRLLRSIYCMVWSGYCYCDLDLYCVPHWPSSPRAVMWAVSGCSDDRPPPLPPAPWSMTHASPRRRGRRWGGAGGGGVLIGRQTLGDAGESSLSIVISAGHRRSRPETRDRCCPAGRSRLTPFSGQFRRQCMHFGNSAGNLGDSAFRRPVGLDSAAAMSGCTFTELHADCPKLVTKRCRDSPAERIDLLRHCRIETGIE